MPDTKSNAEVATEIVREFHVDHQPLNVRAFEFLHLRVEVALATAQSSLARQVLEEIDRNSRGVANDVKAADIATRLRDLFTRLNVRIEEEPTK